MTLSFYGKQEQNQIKMLANHLGKTTRNRRKELGITQPHLAELAKVSTNTLCKLELGQGGDPSLDVMKKLAEALGGLELKIKVKKNCQWTIKY